MAGDLYFHDVTLLLHCEGADGGTTFTDSSEDSRTVTATNATTQVEQYKWGSASAYFDGTGDYLSVGSAADWKSLHVSGAKWTIEGWLRTSTFTGGQFIAHTNRGSSNNVGIACFIQPTDRYLRLFVTAGSATIICNVTSTTAYPDDGNWHYVAFVYDDTLVSANGKIYIDGTLAGSANRANTNSTADPTYTLVIGESGAGVYPFKGYIDDLRITGVARSITAAPTAAFPDYREVPGTGALASVAAAIAGTGAVQGERIGSGALTAQSAAISGAGRAFTTLTGTGALAAQSATIAGAGGIAVTPSLPITMGVLLPVRVGLPIRIDIYSAVTPSLPIQIGPYQVTPTLPIVIKTPVAVTLPSVTITFPGAYMTSAQAYALLDAAIAVIEAGGDTEAIITQLLIDIAPAGTNVVAAIQAALDAYLVDPDDDVAVEDLEAVKALKPDFVTWTPKCILDGTDISSKLIGAQDIEFEETAAPVATFSFIPAAGTVDPLIYVGKPVTLSITIGTATYLAFTGVVSDPVWNADDRTITVSATGDLQSRLDAMTKTAILAQLGGTFSEYVFDDPNNLSGWEYAEALISTQPKVIWQDANGFIRADSILAKATADYTFTASNILDTAQVVRWQGRLDFINKLTVSLGYRFQRRRQRNKKFSFHPYQLETPSMFLSGNEGGWELPQRSQIESAANGGGWTVIGDIRYTPVWPQGYYSTYSDSGTPMMAGLTFNQDEAGNLCIGADWTAAKRWLQTVTEQYTLVVTASDSIEAVGTLATEESYAIEDETTDEAWESSLDYDGYVSGAVVMSNGVDYKDDLDAIRTDVTTAMSVALAKAQNDVLKSHRGTTVGFMTTYDPRLDLSNTVAVDTTYLDCKGKIRRLAHHWDIDTGDATTEVEVALSRHNGTGLASTDTLTPPSEPADPAETAPATYRQLLMHVGGQDDRPVWDESWDGYVCNVAMVGLDKFGGAAYPSTSTTSLASQYYLSNTWQRDPSNPALIGRIYEPGFHILPDEIAATYADPVQVTAASTYDVAVPEDTLTLISG